MLLPKLLRRHASPFPKLLGKRALITEPVIQRDLNNRSRGLRQGMRVRSMSS
jgi:hypothetical protein